MVSERGAAEAKAKRRLLAEHAGWRLSWVLKASGLPRSTHCFEIGKGDFDSKNLDVMDRIRGIFAANKGRYGFRRIVAELRNQGVVANHKKVRRLMAKMGLAAISRKRKYRSYVGEVGHIAKNVIARDFKADGPNEKRATDVSQFACPFGKRYLSPIVDVGSGDVVSWDLSMSPSLGQTMRMLDAAFSKRKDLRGLVFHSDMGWQYQHGAYRKRLEGKGMVQSMSRKGNCLDNCIMESFFGVMRNEMFYGRESEFRTFEEFKKAVSECIDYYSNRRIKSKTKWMPPAKYRAASMLTT